MRIRERGAVLEGFAAGEVLGFCAGLVGWILLAPFLFLSFLFLLFAARGRREEREGGCRGFSEVWWYRCDVDGRSC